MAWSDSAYLALLSAFVVAVFGAVALLFGAQPGRSRRLHAAGRRAAFAVAALVTYASGMLLVLLVSHDFALGYVAEVSNRSMTVPQLLSAFWGGQPGSLLLWAWILSLFTVGVAVAHRGQTRALASAAMGVLLSIEAFFLVVLDLAANPFQKLPVPLADGQGLNPLLLDPAMRLHPPLILTGYVSFAVPYAFGMAALLTGNVGLSWVRAVRRWLILAWTIQGLGLVVGAWWAYHVLGWGGYWGWDPVENVALLPWLVATALLHSLMVQEKRGMLKLWNLGLAVSAFGLSIFGTFVVRSGVITSVHSFATSAVGPYFFVFLGVSLLVSLALIGYRLPLLRAENGFDAVASRETAFLLNNYLLVGIVAMTFWGTIFPMLSETFRGAKIAVGAPYYRQVNTPALLALLVLMGIGPLFAWRRTSLSRLFVQLRFPLALGAVVGITLLVLGAPLGLATLAFAACAFVGGTIVVEYARGIASRRRSGEPFLTAVRTLIVRDRRRYGGYLVHLAMLLIAVGIIGSSSYQQVVEGTVAPGAALTVGRYHIVNDGVTAVNRTDMAAVTGNVTVQTGNRTLGVVHPDRRVYAHWETQPVTGVAIMTTFPWMEDVYVMMTNLDANGAMALRVFVNPLVSCIWLGAVLFLAATVVVAWPDRRRPATDRPRQFLPEAARSET